MRCENCIHSNICKKKEDFELRIKKVLEKEELKDLELNISCKDYCTWAYKETINIPNKMFPFYKGIADWTVRLGEVIH